MVYGIEDAIKIAEENPGEDVVFMAVGFETTAPTTGSVLCANPPNNFSILCCHRTIPQALKAIIEMGEVKLDGLIEPGHVSTIIGTKPYEYLSKNYKIPQVVAGFEPIDILMGCWMLVDQIKNNKALVQNEYKRVVHPDGNIKAKEILKDVFEPCDIKWRGFPVIKDSGLELKNKFEDFDARKKFEDVLADVQNKKFSEPEGCRCGELLRGLLTPFDCPLFGQACTPETPVGPCMVSVEGSCNIEYRYKEK
jgi:hydrogenase expression/formation protein HypD